MRAPNFIKEQKGLVEQIITQKIAGSDNNKRVYELEDVVTFYAGQDNLQKPEKAVLSQLKNTLPQMTMLDIGVGAGRTTLYFAPVTKQYLGVDYSAKMIDACRLRFKHYHKTVSFLTVDARSMKRFNKRSFDFILFSFNGIDYMKHEERLETLFEIRQLLKQGGYFCFSTHNLNYLLDKCSIILSKHPTIFMPHIFSVLKMRLLNQNEAWRIIRNSSRKQGHSLINDGAHDFKLKTYYITPNEQLKQLQQQGYLETKMYGLDGHEIIDPATATDQWIYFLSRVA